MLRLTTLGAIDLRDRLGHPLREVLAQPKRVALLVYIALEASRGPVSRDRLLALFWPESDESKARNALSQALYHLRQALGTDVIENHGANALAVRPETIWCDAAALAEALERGDVDLALDLYRGDFCPGHFASGTPDVEHWMDGLRQRLRSKVLTAAQERAESLAAAGEREAACRMARRALALFPDDEADVRALLALLERMGDATGALHAYQEFTRHLQATLEADPAPETQALAEGIRRRRDEAPPSPPAVHPASVRDAEPGSVHPAVEIAPAAALRRSRRSVLIGTAAAVIIALVAMAATLRVRTERMASPLARAIAVMPFTLHAGVDLDYLRHGMVDLLSAKLSGVPGVQVIDPRSVIAAIAAAGGDDDPELADGAAIARRLGAGRYITGEVTEVAGRLQFSGTLHEAASGRGISSAATVLGDTAAVFELVDELAGRILAGLTTARDTSLTRLAALTTQSLPALKAYLEGERALRAGLDAQAAAAFRVASQLDTTFALAQYRLAMTATWVAVPEVEDPAKWAAIAARHSGRLSPLGRDLVNAYDAYKAVRIEEAERRYAGITEAHPDNVEAWFMLGETRYHYNAIIGRSPVEGRAPFRRALALDPTNLHAIIHLARLAAWDGSLAELDSLANRYHELSPEAQRNLELRGLLAFARNDSAEQAAVVGEALEADDRIVSSLISAATLFAQNLDAAKQLAPAVILRVQDPLSRLAGLRNVTELNLVGGQWGREALVRQFGAAVDDDWLLETEALLASDPILPLPRERIAAIRDRVAARRPFPGQQRALAPPDPAVGAAMQSYLLGLLEIRLGDTVSARNRAKAFLLTQDSRHPGMSEAMGRELRAELARHSGDLSGALGEIERTQWNFAMSWSPSSAHWGVRQRFLKAELLLGLGRDEEAVPVYESFQWGYDAPWVPLTLLRLSQIRARQGEMERAAFHAARFRALWRDADPALRVLLDSLPGGTAVEGGGGTRPSAPAVAR